MTETLTVADLLEQVQGYGAWAVIRRKAAPTAGLVGGTPHEVESLLDIPLESGIPEPGRSADRLVAVPFRQVRERGFEVIDDDAPLTVVDIEAEHEVDVSDLLAALPDVPVEFSDRGGFEITDADYEEIVETIIRDEIGQGEGANLVIGRHYRAVERRYYQAVAYGQCTSLDSGVGNLIGEENAAAASVKDDEIAAFGNHIEVAGRHHRCGGYSGG